MDNINDEIMNENESSLILNDDCIMQIFERLSIVDYSNFAYTCRRLRDVSGDFSALKHKNIEINSASALDNIISRQEFLNVLSVIGHNVLEVKINNSNDFMLKSVKVKCVNLERIDVHSHLKPELMGFRNLKQLKLRIDKSIDNIDWKYFFASNPELEVIDYNYYGCYQKGFMELLINLPKLQSLGLPNIPRSLHRSVDYQPVLQLTGLTRLSLRSSDNLNFILVELAKSLNLVELNIRMKFDDASLGIIKSFQNLETLSIFSIDGVGNEALFSNATMFPTRLQRLKIQITRILCMKVLEIVQYTLVKEIDFGVGGLVAGNMIFWSDQSKNVEDSQAFVIKKLENALIREGRKLKMFCRYYGSSLYLYRSDHLEIINSNFVERDGRLRLSLLCPK